METNTHTRDAHGRHIAASDVAAWDGDTDVVLQDIADGSTHMLGVRLQSQEDPDTFMSAWLNVEQAAGLAETLATYIAEVRRQNVNASCAAFEALSPAEREQVRHDVAAETMGLGE
ncbi:MAG: hypothetical protein ACRDPS_09630 [Nocardioides sp.]|uniref:hypothetical protein n=1 Tax=Nocardioides sp. TaxID=35761 RepID=UPI003D6A36C4